MDPVAPDYNAHSIEAEGLSLWRGRRLPPPGGVLGPPTGPTVRQFEGAWTQGDFASLIAHRAVAADVDARYLALAGRRAVGTLRQATGSVPAGPTGVPGLLTALGVWTGGNGQIPWDSEDRTAGVQAIVGRLAAKGILVTRDDSFRVCPSCGSPRSPERIVYDQQEADTFLVRFPVRIGDRDVNALVWVDVPWKLLGTSAILVNPETRYVVADYRRRDEHEVVLTSAPSLHRLRAWIPEATLEVLEERPGKEFQGTPYLYPLRHEFPMGGDLSAPAGTVLTATDVSESGTGIVPLVPGHGPTDARIAARFGVAGWPLVTPKGKLDFTLMHKYAGLDLETANEFVLRDLSEAGALLARLRVKRGVPYCGVCGTALLWTPGRAWCLEPSHLPAERRAMFSRLLPQESLPAETEVAPWPVSEASPNDGPGSLALLECTRCERLDAPDGPAQCPCGGPRRVVRRLLLPSSGAAFAAWARFDPTPDGDTVHLYVGRRRRLPAVVNHLAALCGIPDFVGEVNLTVIPTVAAADAPDLVGNFGADAVRAALVRSGVADPTGGPFGDRCRQEADRIRRWWTVSREVAAKCDPAMLATFARPISGFLGELEVEDRAIVARWERTRTLTLAHYDNWAPALAYRRVSRFLDNDLVEYRELVQPRLALAGTPTTKRGALRTLAHLTRGLSAVLAPILPFTSEGIHRALSSERSSIFDQPMAGLDRTLLNDDLVAAWDRWSTVSRAVDRFRRSVGVSRTTPLPLVVLVAPADDVGDRLRGEKETLARLARVQRLEIASPREPWTGRHRTLHPVESEIQKAYPTQASQIVHLLQHMPPRRRETAVGQEELTVVINGLPRRVFPNMVTFSDTLPDRVVPSPWSLGEMYVELPTAAAVAKRAIPPLSTDAYWLVRRIERGLRAAPPATDRIAVVTAKDPLATELRAAAETIAGYLGLRELRVVPRSEEATPPNAMTGRTRTGDAWWVHVPNLPARRPRAKRPRTGVRMERVSWPTVAAPTEEVDYADEKFVAHEEDVRALGQELDDIIGLPLLGPSKVSLAWERGVHSVEDLRRSPFETVATLPGFGGPVAELVFTKLGGQAPPHRLRVIPRSATASPRAVDLAATRALVAVEERRPPSLPPSTASPTRAVPPASPPPELSARPEAETAPKAAPETAETIDAGEMKAEPAVAARAETELEPTPPIDSDTFTVSQPAVTAEPGPGSVPVVESPTVEPSVLPVSTPPSEVPTPPEPTAVPEHGEVPDEGAEAEVATPVLESTPVEEAPFPTEVPSAMSELPAPEEAGPPETPPTLGPSEEMAPSPEAAIVPTEPELVPEPPSPAEGEAEPGSVDQIASEETARSTPESAEPSSLPETRNLPEEEVATPTETTVPEPHPTEAIGVAETPLLPAEPVEPPETVPAELIPAESAEPPPLLETPPPIEEQSPSSLETSMNEPVIEAPEEAPRGNEETPPAPAGPEPDLESTSVPETIPPAAPTDVGTIPPVVLPLSPVEPPAPIPPISVAVPAPVLAPVAPEPPPPPSGVELAAGDSLVASLSGILEAASAGHRGVCVVRESPERIRTRVGSRPIEVFWLTNIGRGPALRPSDLEGAWTFLSQKLLEERVTAFFLEGIEYLVRLHGADAVLNGLVQFDRLARENDARVWLYLAPGLMKAEDLERFQSTFGGSQASS
ncbi:MAG: class I tRNA ligase family protein [Thermoplasmata archaeon]